MPGTFILQGSCCQHVIVVRAGRTRDLPVNELFLAHRSAEHWFAIVLRALVAGCYCRQIGAGLGQLLNTHHEMNQSVESNARLWLMFLAVPLVGPLAAWIGFSWLSTNTVIIGVVMLFCSGGILYLIFDDIAPRGHLKHHDLPAVGAVSGFLLGLMGTMLIH